MLREETQIPKEDTTL